LIFFLKVLGAVAALVLGIYLGGSGRAQSPEEISARLGKGYHRKPKRHFMWLNYLKVGQRGSERRRKRQHFKTAIAKDFPKKRSEDD